MSALYTPALVLIMLLATGCSKDVLRSYDRRIVGSWRIADIDRFGFGGGDNLPFSEGGVFQFEDDGTVTYTYSGTTYRGSWDIRRLQNGDETQRALQITVVDFNNQIILSDYFNEMLFTGANRFQAYIYYGSRTYLYRFRRT